MANSYFSMNRGAGSQLLGSNITEGSATNAGADFELRVQSTNNPTRLDVIQFLEQMRKFILSNGCDGADTTNARGGTLLPPL